MLGAPADIPVGHQQVHRHVIAPADQPRADTVAEVDPDLCPRKAGKIAVIVASAIAHAVAPKVVAKAGTMQMASRVSCRMGRFSFGSRIPKAPSCRSSMLRMRCMFIRRVFSTQRGAATPLAVLPGPFDQPAGIHLQLLGNIQHHRLCPTVLLVATRRLKIWSFFSRITSGGISRRILRIWVRISFLYSRRSIFDIEYLPLSAAPPRGLSGRKSAQGQIPGRRPAPFAVMYWPSRTTP